MLWQPLFPPCPPFAFFLSGARFISSERLYPVCWLTMTRETCPSLSLSFSLIFLVLPRDLSSYRRLLGSGPFDSFVLSLSRGQGVAISPTLSGMLIKTLLLLLLLLPSLSLLLSRPERVPHGKSCQMAICGIFEPHVRTYWLYQKLCILSSYTENSLLKLQTIFAERISYCCYHLSVVNIKHADKIGFQILQVLL